MRSIVRGRSARHGLLATAGVAVLVAATLVVSSVSAYAATLFSDNFEDGSADGWSRSGGSWSVVSDGSQAYRQSSTGSDAKAQAGSGWGDQTAQARVKPLAWGSSPDRLAGVLARAQNMTNYYYLALNDSDQVVLGKRVSGGYSTLASAPVGVSTGTWYTLRLEAFGSQLRGYVDDQQVVSASDGSLGSGRVGLLTRYASASFDDVLVTDQPGSGEPPTGPPPTTAPPPTSPPPTSPPPTTPPPPPTGEADGFAGMNALGQNGTTGGAGGPTVTVDSASEFLDAIGQSGPLVIQVNGTIDLSGPMHDVTSDKSILGLGDNARITGGGLNIGLPIDDGITSPPANAVHNVIIRNLTLSGWDDDAINVQMFTHHVWLDHNTFVNTSADGALDVKRGSDYVTISWNHTTHDKNMLLGHDDDNAAQDVGRLGVTYHHNWFDGTQQRNPRVRFGDPVHVYNNYYLANEDYGVRAAMDSGVLIEGNYFEDVEDPFHRESGGSIMARDNCFDNSEQGDAGGSVAPIPYSYTAQPCGEVPATVRAGAGAGNIDGTPPPTTNPPPTTPPPPTSPPPPPVPGDGPIGWASMAGGTTGGAGGGTVTVTDGDTFAELLEEDEPLVIRVQGMLTMPDGMNDVHSDKTIIGVGAGSGIDGAGLNISSGYDNIIIRNLNFEDWPDDAVNIQNEAHHIWVDHNSFTSGGDGSVDVKRGSDYVTVSWNHTTHDKNMLLGHDDDNAGQDVGHLRVTYHHNWFDGSAERNPRVRFGNPVHVFNNYYDNNEVYGVASTMDAGVLVEGNYFQGVPQPIAVGYADSGPGNVIERDNVFVDSGAVESTGTGVASIPYGYELDDPDDVPALVTAGAGPQPSL